MVEREVLNYKQRENFRLFQSAAVVMLRNMASELVCYSHGTK